MKRTGKATRLAALAKRREASKGSVPIDNASLPAGAPMYLPCISCGDLIEHAETYTLRRCLCDDCRELKELGWLE